jgi:hypothetical protein
MISFIFQDDIKNRLDRILLRVGGISFVVFGLLNGISPRGGGHNSIISQVPENLQGAVFFLNSVTTIILTISFLWLGIRVTARLAKRSFTSQTLYMLGRVLLYIFLPSAIIATILILIFWVRGELRL